ncbi:MAG: M2 family metallopeptidase [Bacteroidales bacterium]|nr:M2 family metallopeptidase [Bacteroidales bacterium]
MKLLKKIILASGLVFMLACNQDETKMRADFKKFIFEYDSVIVPLSKEMNLAQWSASISGKTEDYERYALLKKKYAMFHTNRDAFKLLEKIKASGVITDSIEQRQLQVLYLTYLSFQADTNLQKEIIELENKIEQKYSTFRAVINDSSYTDNEIEHILKNSTDNTLLQAAWEAHKRIGPVVSADIISLVKKRNTLARQLGFANFHEMSLKLNDQDPNEIEKLFDELDKLTFESFAKVKSEIDQFLAKRYKINPDQLMPWHYQNRFFQEAPEIYPVDLDKYYKNQNLEKVTSQFYQSIGLPIDDLLAKSDLYEKPGKNQHAFCTDIDNEGDVRVLCNIKPNEQWMNTMLHEFGHAVYDKYIDRQLPFVLRQPAHIFTTEAIAMLFGRLSKNPYWMTEAIGLSKQEAKVISESCYNTLRLEQLVFSRWSQVMYRFEKSMYENPDQDLNALWWKLVEKYQMLKKPFNRNEPDWASKIHIATVPCYYHNYLLGELLASQLHYYICYHVVNDTTDIRRVSYYNHPEVGKFLQEKVFKPGMRYQWNEMIEKATGEKLSVKYYARQFVK